MTGWEQFFILIFSLSLSFQLVSRALSAVTLTDIVIVIASNLTGKCTYFDVKQSTHTHTHTSSYRLCAALGQIKLKLHIYSA